MVGGTIGTWAGTPLYTRIGADTLPLSPGGAGVQVSVPCQNPPPLACDIFVGTTYLAFSTCSSTPCELQPYYDSGYRSRGQLEFDLLLDIPVSEINNVSVYYGSPLCYAAHHIPVSQLTNTLTHHVISFDDFSTPSCSYPKTSPFQISVIRKQPGTSPAAFSVGNVQWVVP